MSPYGFNELSAYTPRNVPADGDDRRVMEQAARMAVATTGAPKAVPHSPTERSR